MPIMYATIAQIVAMVVAACRASGWPQRGNDVAQPLTKQLKAVAQRLISAWQANVKALQFGCVYAAMFLHGRYFCTLLTHVYC